MARLKNSDVVILAARRSPIGKFGGALKDWSAPQIAGPCIKQVLKDAKLDPAQVDRVIMGHVLSAGVGQHPAKQAAFEGGLPESCPAHSENKVCASSLQALWGASHFARLEDEIAIAGGMESMSQSPYDHMIHDGLTDAYCEGNPHMGKLADDLAQSYHDKLSRRQQDEYAFESHRRAYNAKKLGARTLGVCGVGYPTSVDEGVREPNLEEISQLNPVFGETITAGNASQLSDGAAAILVSTYKKAKELGVKPIARIVAFADYSQMPEFYTIAPVKAAAKVLLKVGMQDVDLFEVNEAFAVVPLYFLRFLGHPEKLNFWGGAIAQGHPIGASGVKIVVTLAHALRYTGGRYGLAVACHGGGGAVAVIIENLER